MLLLQRGVYPPSEFSAVQKYGLQLLVTTDTGLQEYIGNVLKSVRDWLMAHMLQKIVLVVSGVDSGETLERWTFDIEADKEITADGCAGPFSGALLPQ